MEKEASNNQILETGKTEANLIDRAEAVARRIEEGNKRAEELLAKNEQVLSRSILGGRTDAGQVQAPQPVISNKEYAQKVLRGEFNEKK
jgi:hypothetical protein